MGRLRREWHRRTLALFGVASKIYGLPGAGGRVVSRLLLLLGLVGLLQLLIYLLDAAFVPVFHLLDQIARVGGLRCVQSVGHIDLSLDLVAHSSFFGHRRSSFLLGSRSRPIYSCRFCALPAHAYQCLHITYNVH